MDTVTAVFLRSKLVRQGDSNPRPLLSEKDDRSLHQQRCLIVSNFSYQ